MDEYSKFIDFLLTNGFSLIENKLDRIFIYERNGLFIQITQELGGRRFISLSRMNSNSPEGWHDMYDVRLFILKSNYKKDSIGTIELRKFFIEHFEEIVEAFDTSNFPATEERLQYLRKEGARINYGLQ